MHLAVDPRSILAHLPDVLTRGTTVVAVFAAVLAATGFFQPAELRALRRLRARSATGGGGRVRPTDSTEMAGEIVATDVEMPE